MLRERRENAWDVIARINDDGLARLFVAEDGAIALEQADREGLANHE
jgi:hypothetical protein